MNEKRIPIENENPKHKKKSIAKGQTRSKHKHEYKTVLLHSCVEHPFNKGEFHEILSAKKVCAICGRIGDTDYEQYEKVQVDGIHTNLYERKLKNPEMLEDWYCEGYLAKFAYRKEE